MKPYISVIVPVYNAEKTIKRCIVSVISQNLINFELLLVDDGSSDRSGFICDDFARGDRRIKVIHKNNAGVSAARNTGIEKATGNYITFLDADDWLESGILNRIYSETKDNNCDILITSFFKEYKNKSYYSTICIEERSIYNSEHNDFNPYNARIIGCVWARYYRNELIKSFRFSRDLSFCEDAEFNFRIFSKARSFIYLNKPGYHYLYSSSSTLRTYREADIDKYIEALKVIGNNVKIFNNKRVMKCYYNFTSTVFNVICMNLIFNRRNKNSLFYKFNCLHKICKQSIFNKALREVDIKELSLPHKILIFCGKNHFYLGIYILSMINEIINKYFMVN